MDEDSHDFQYKTAQHLDVKGWDTEISPYYADVVTQKPREIDIIARKRWPVADRFNRKHAKLEIRLFIECKWVPADVSTHVIFIPLDTTLASFLAKNNDLLRSYDYPPLQDINKNPPRIHHYLESPKIAKSVACKGSKGNRDYFHDAWDQALHAFIYHKHHGDKFRFMPIDEDYTRDMTHIIDYSLVVVSSFDSFFHRDPIAKKSSPMNENFVFSVSYVYPIHIDNTKTRFLKEDFFIDVTSFSTLAVFLENLERNDVEILKERAWFNLNR